MNVLSLCSGIGALDLGVKLAAPEARTVCYVEIEPYCQEILLRRADDGWLDRAPIWPDLATFDGRQWRGFVDCVIGGYPCQPFSFSGKRRGAADLRHLWPHVARIVDECQPAFAFFENVAGHLSLGFPEVAEALEGMGYGVSAGLFTAAEVGAPHRRQRLYILARRQQGHSMADAGCWRKHEDQSGRGGRPSGARTTGPCLGVSAMGATIGARWATPGVGFHQHAAQESEAGSGNVLGHPNLPRLEGWLEPERAGADELPAWPPGPAERDRWAAILAVRPDLAPAVADADGAGCQRAPVHLPTWKARDTVPDPGGTGGGMAETSAQAQPALRRVANGRASRLDRLRALGNAVVPATAALAWRTLMATMTEEA